MSSILNTEFGNYEDQWVTAYAPKEFIVQVATYQPGLVQVTESLLSRICK